MPFVAAHNYLTVHWQVAGTPEKGQFGMRFAGTAVPTQALVDGCKSAVSTMWAASTSNIWLKFELTFLRLARIGTDGLYVPGTTAFDANFTPVVAGGRSTGPTIYPLSVAQAVTLRTAAARGLAHAGRVYMPPLAESLQTDGTWAIAVVNSRVNTFASMCTALNGAGIGTLNVMSQGTPRDPTPINRVVTFVNADNRPDVQRRRSKQQLATISANWTV